MTGLLKTAARGLARRAALMLAAGLVGAVGCGFLGHAGFAGLRLVVGPELAALIMGIACLVIAAVLASAASGERQARATGQPGPVPASPADIPPRDPVTMAVFTAAFVLGRRLADRRRG